MGRTGHHSSVAILGGAAFARATPEEAAGPFADALGRGVNHLDVAPRYGDAEHVLGPLVEPVRDELFLACKTTRRNPDGVRAQLSESLRRLRTDHFDLYQLHAVTDPDVLDERGRAAEVLLEAREEGTVRSVGITGHGHDAPAAFLEALRRYDLDTVMFPVNPRMWADPEYRRDAEGLLARCEERGVGVMAIKAAARRPWGSGERFASTWYEPYEDPEDIAGGVAFTLSVPGVDAFCTPGDLDLLPWVLDAAERRSTMTEGERETAVADAASLPSIFPVPT